MNFEDLKEEIPQIFERVKSDVKNLYGRRRAGLSLGLVEMGMFGGAFIGGMHFPPGTDIVMNKTPLRMILENQPSEIVRAYTYHILLHEYIHSLGVWDENQCRYLTQKITEDVFKDSQHPAVILARKGIGAYFNDIPMVYAPPGFEPEGIAIEYIKYFDRESFDFYS